MFEHQKHTISFAERLRPDVTPEMGFQSYEMLAGDGEYRRVEEMKFLAGEVRNPLLDYPKIDEQILRQGITKLEGILTESRDLDDETAADAIWDTTSYRMAEMYWLLEAKRMNQLANDNPNSDEFLQSAARYQAANEELYGKPNDELIGKAFGEVLAQAHEKDLHPSAQKILDELVNGFDTTLASGETLHVDGIGDDFSERLPENIAEKLSYLREVLEEDNHDIHELVENYWNQVVLKRDTANDQTSGFTVEDMKELFTRVHALRDPENTSRISVVIHNGSTQLAWDTPSMSVRIGAKRAPIASVDDMFAKIIHEYGIHGTGAVEGLKTDLPILGSGVYSAADEGEESDYLTFEEGFASLAEIAVDGSFTSWKPLHVSRYIAAATAYRGMDFRQSFEVNWRARVLMVAKSGQEVGDDVIEKEKKQAYLSVTRLYRGTPTKLSNGPILTFNKDLAYLSGKMAGLKFLERVGDDKDAIRFAMKTKTDPNNHYQAELAQRYAAA